MKHSPVSPARRHFLGLTAAATGRVAASGALGMAALSSAQAKNNNNHPGWSIGVGNPHGGGGHCFLRGTRILTKEGEARIEDLGVGDLVETVRREFVPIKWIGRNVFKRSSPMWHQGVVPIRVSRSAIEAQTPHSDLYLSRWHCLFIDGCLMPVKDLINGASIAPAEPAESEIEYFHIVLATHEVIFAEGAPAETLLMATGDEYETFSNFGEYERLYSKHGSAIMAPFAPVVGYSGGKAHLKALLRLGVSTVVDVRDPVQVAYDRIAQRAKEYSFA